MARRPRITFDVIPTPKKLVIPQTGVDTYGDNVTLNASTGEEIAFLDQVSIEQSGDGSFVTRGFDVTLVSVGTGTKFLDRLRVDGDVQWSVDVVGNAVVGGNITVASGFIEASIATGLIASTTQTQAGGLKLTAQKNIITTVANEGDAVTVTPAIVGRSQQVVNKGLNPLQVFPALGDNFGLGVNEPGIIPQNEVVTIVGIDAGNWYITTETLVVSTTMIDEDNTTAFVINATNELHAYHTAGMIGVEDGFSFDAGGVGTSFPIASIADDGDGNILVTTTGSHTLVVGTVVGHTNFSDAAYNGLFMVLTVPGATTYTVTAVFTATGTGTLDEPATLTCNEGFTGQYDLSYHGSAVGASNNQTIDFAMFKQDVSIFGTKSRTKFGTGDDFGYFGGGSIVTIFEGEKVFLVVSNALASDNIIIRHVGIKIVRL